MCRKRIEASVHRNHEEGREISRPFRFPASSTQSGSGKNGIGQLLYLFVFTHYPTQNRNALLLEML